MNAWQLLLAIRELYSRHPEYFHHEPWELVHILYSLNYTDDLADEAEISAAVEVVRTDWPATMEAGGMREDVHLAMASLSKATLVKGA